MNKTEIVEMLQHIKPEELYPFIASYAAENEVFYQKLKGTFFSGNNDIIDLASCRLKAKGCFKFSEEIGGRYKKHDDYYQAANDAAFLLDQLLSDADYFLKHEEYGSAAGLAMAVAEIIPFGYEYVDDSSGNLAQTFHSATEIIIALLRNKQVARRVKESIYEWAKEEAKKPEYANYGFENIDEICDAGTDELGETDDVLTEIEYCKKGSSFITNSLEKYEAYLKPHFEKELLDIYIAQVEEAAPGQNYHQVAHILRHIRTFKGGDEIVDQKLQEFRQTYKRRRKMMTILDTV